MSSAALQHRIEELYASDEVRDRVSDAWAEELLYVAPQIEAHTADLLACLTGVDLPVSLRIPVSSRSLLSGSEQIVVATFTVSTDRLAKNSQVLRAVRHTESVYAEFEIVETYFWKGVSTVQATIRLTIDPTWFNHLLDTLAAREALSLLA